MEPNARPDPYRYGSQRYGLEPHTQEQTTQSTDVNHFDANEEGVIINTYSFMVDPQLWFGQSQPQDIGQHQPGFMTCPSNVPAGYSLPAEPSPNNGFQAPARVLPPFVEYVPDPNLCPPSAPSQFAQNQNTYHDSALHHPSYPTVLPATTNAGYLSLGNHASPINFYHDVAQPSALQAQNDFYHDVAQPTSQHAQKRYRSPSPERETASSGNPRAQSNEPQVEDIGHTSKRARNGESQAFPDIPPRFKHLGKEMEEILSRLNNPPTSRDKKVTLLVPEDFDDPQLIRDCKSQEPAEPGALKCSSLREARDRAEKSKTLFYKKAEKCTYPHNDETFPRNDAEERFFALLLYGALRDFESIQEWIRCLPDELCKEKQRDLTKTCKERTERRKQIMEDRALSNKASGSDDGDYDEELNRPILELADLLPTPEQAKEMPPVADRHKKILGKNVLNAEVASGESWRLLDRAIEAQQGRTGVRLATTTDCCWESYPRFLERILTLVNVLRTSKQTVKSLLTQGDGWSQRLANNPYAEQANKIENMKTNMHKKIANLEKAEAAKKAEKSAK